MKKITRIIQTSLLGFSVLSGCTPVETELKNSSSLKQPSVQSGSNDKRYADINNWQPEQEKAVVYQVFTRLFGNKNTTNKAWGTIEENGVGKFSDFNEAALNGIRELGVTHIWYTGVPHHAVINDYQDYGITLDDPDVVKGRAGSPYAVKDYYSVNPDLADDPTKRLEEFESLIARTHAHGMKVIIDIVPNHVARNYQSLAKPEGVSDFGENDNKSVQYARDNNFYYVVGESFKVPELTNNKPLGGEDRPLSDGKFEETPAKWTGNGSRASQPNEHDWYETVKVNYGITPDGKKDFPELPESFRTKSVAEHYKFWQQQAEKNLIPDSWFKFRDITLYWTYKGVDGFRFDMSEMVPVEFWSFLNSSIKMANPNAFLLAEIYNPDVYRDYIQLGKMDYLYDKVDFYDSIKALMQGKAPASNLSQIQQRFADIEKNLLHFLDNHDEQRLASDGFAGDMQKGKPAMVVSTLINSAPMMIYFGQEVGEDGSEETGFGDPTRTTIFDYAGVPAHQRWMNDGLFDGGQLSPAEKDLRAYYRDLLNFATDNDAIIGSYLDLHKWNLAKSNGYDESLMSFARWSENNKVLVVSNFGDNKGNISNKSHKKEFLLNLSPKLLAKWQLEDGQYSTIDLFTQEKHVLNVGNGSATIPVRLAANQSLVLTLSEQAIKPSKQINKGTVVILDDVVHLEKLDRKRTLRIYLPPTYHASSKGITKGNTNGKYPVIYMHDAQNLFDDKTSFVGEWGVDETMDDLYARFGFEAIVVGIDNVGDKRLNEYSAWSHEKYGEAEGHLYMDDVVNVVKPFIDQNYRTKTTPDSTAIIGSSMGSLISHYGAIQYPETFGRVGLFSTSYWYAPAIYDWTSSKLQNSQAKFYFLVGEKEGKDMVENQHSMVSLFSQPNVKDSRVKALVEPKGEHNEHFWRKELPTALIWLFDLN